MGYIEFTTAEIGVDKAIKATTLGKIRNNLEWMREAYTYNLTKVPNHDFEFVTNGLPDLWTISTYETGFVGITSSTSHSGKHALMFINDGSTQSGGEAESEYIPLYSAATVVQLKFTRWGDNMKRGPFMRTYDGNFGIISTLGGFSTAPSTSPSTVTQPMSPITTNMKWCKIIFRTDTASTQAGTAYFDNVRLDVF
jgi:hypothetical protein